MSRWESAYSLWHRMRGDIADEPDKDIYNVGKAFELALAELWKIEHPGWKLSRGEVQFVTDGLGFPAMATVDRRAMRGRRRKLVEFKIARDLNEVTRTFPGTSPATMSPRSPFSRSSPESPPRRTWWSWRPGSNTSPTTWNMMT